jgi:hypothetical protein
MKVISVAFRMAAIGIWELETGLLGNLEKAKNDGIKSYFVCDNFQSELNILSEN